MNPTRFRRVLWIATRSRRLVRGKVPFEGDTLEVQGTVKIGATLANRQFAVIVIEDDRP